MASEIDKKEIDDEIDNLDDEQISEESDLINEFQPEIPSETLQEDKPPKHENKGNRFDKTKSAVPRMLGRNSLIERTIRKNEEDVDKDEENANKEEDNETNKEISPNKNASKSFLKNINQGTKKEAKKEVKGKAVKFVLSKVPIWVWLILLVALILIFIIIVIFSDDDEGGGSAYDENCQVFSIKVTSLSKKEFVEKTSDYLDNRYYKTEDGRQAAMDFKKNLKTIYTESKKAGVNPELVVIRANNEGFVPGGCKNNFWAIGCGNTSAGCNCNEGDTGNKYDTFKEGLNAFLNIVSQSPDAVSMMSSYSYLGQYWYNPGNSGLGGCYYFTKGGIGQYMSAKRASEVAHICRDPEVYPDAACSKSNTTNCVETTEEDRRAKTLGSVWAMAYTRRDIYGLEPYDCLVPPDDGSGNYSATCTVYYQGDSRWGDIHLGDSNATMASAGCAVTSIAIGISCANTDIAVSNFDAGVLIDALNKDKDECFTPSGAIYWGCSAIKKVAPTVRLASIERLKDLNLSTSQIKKKIQDAKKSNTFVILHYKNETTSSHYVVFDSFKDNKTYLAKDPCGKVVEHEINEVDQIVVYSFSPKTKSTSEIVNGNYTTRIDNTSSSSVKTTVLDKPIKNLLSADELKSLNYNIYSSVKSAGVGTRAAIIQAAVIPVKYLAEEYGYLVPYTWGGGHDATIAGIKNTVYGVDPNWGTKIDYYAHDTIYPYYGVDCAGWVTWVLRNAGVEIGDNAVNGFWSLPGTKIYKTSEFTAQPGDLLIQSGHVTVVVGVDNVNKKYYIAHSTNTGNYGALIIEPVKMDTIYYDIVDMSGYLVNHDRSNYDELYREALNP